MSSPKRRTPRVPGDKPHPQLAIGQVGPPAPEEFRPTTFWHDYEAWWQRNYCQLFADGMVDEDTQKDRYQQWYLDYLKPFLLELEQQLQTILGELDAGDRHAHASVRELCLELAAKKGEEDACKLLVSHWEENWRERASPPWRSHQSQFYQVGLLNVRQDACLSEVLTQLVRFAVDGNINEYLRAQAASGLRLALADFLGHRGHEVETSPQALAGDDDIHELTEDDVNILRYLAEQPKISKSQQDISAGADLDQKTLRQRLRLLKERGYAKTPDGYKRRGTVITDEGLKRLKSLG